MPNSVEATSASEVTNKGADNRLAAFSGEAMTSTSVNTEWFAINSKARENQQHLPQLTLDEFLNNSEPVLTKIDVDRDGWVGVDEVTQAVDNPYIRGKDAQVVSALYDLQTASKDFQLSGELTNPLQMLEIDGAKAKLETLIDAASSRNKAPHQDYLIFPILDHNGDDVISRSELSEAMKDPSTGNGSLAVAMRMFQRRDAQAFSQGKPYKGLTRENVDSLNQVMDDTDFYVKGVVSHALEQTSASQRSLKTTDAFANKEDLLKSISSAAINQGAVGNCYFQSVLASIADKRPELIRDMIEDQGNGLYKVTFPGDKENPMYVSTPSDINITKFNRPNEQGMWPNILEKAFGKYEAIKRDIPLDAVPNALGADSGGDPANAIRLLTGNEANSNDISGLVKVNKDNPAFINRYTETFKEWLDEGKIVSSSTGESEHKDDLGLQSMHAFTVMSHYEQDGKTYFVLRDPWGDHSRVKINKNGVFSMEAKDFLQSFPVFAVESSNR